VTSAPGDTAPAPRGPTNPTELFFNAQHAPEESTDD
jgi:hypothetical protein